MTPMPGERVADKQAQPQEPCQEYADNKGEHHCDEFG